MKTQIAVLGTLIVALATLGLSAATSPQEPGPEPARGMLTPLGGETELSSLGFVSGSWSGIGLGGDVDAHWSSATVNNIVGTLRVTRAGRTMLFELATIERGRDGIELRFQRFSSGWKEIDEEPRVLRLTSVEGRRAVFTADDPQQDPYEVTLERRPDGTLVRVTKTPDGGSGEHWMQVELTRDESAVGG